MVITSATGHYLDPEARQVWDPGGLLKDFQQNAKWENKVRIVAAQIAELFPDSSVHVERLGSVVRAALGEAADGNYNEQSAIEWAAGFSFPANICERDSNLLDLADGDLVVMAKLSHEARENEGRLSTARVHATVPRDDPDFEKLLILCDGVKILVPKDFTPNTTPPLLRNKYKRVCTAVNKMFFEGYLEGLVYLLPTHRLLSMSGIHWSSAHWTTKAGKQKGRNIGDLSNDERGGALNSPEAKLLGQEAWGDIKHPTVDMLVGMVIRQYKRSANGWADVVLWKMDLKGAFTLMFIHPESVPLLAMQLTGGVSMVYHTGLFGSTLMPGAFDVISRVLRRRINSVIKGEIEIFVDDIMGACLTGELSSDLKDCTDVCTGLLGPNAVAVEKTGDTLATGHIDWLGWDINVTKGIIGISRKNFLRALYGFFDVDISKKVKVRTLQKLASWASRYSLVCRALRPMTSALYAESSGMRNLEVSKTLSGEAVVCIHMWRLFLVAMELEGEGYRRSLLTFELESPSFVIEYDSSLTGFGFRIFRIEYGSELLWRIASVDADFSLRGVSSYQNTMEYISVVLAFGYLIQQGERSKTVCVRGDNVTSLKWATTERFKGTLCTNAAVCLLALLSASSMDVVDATHIRGVENCVCDDLSRGVRPEALGYYGDVVINESNSFLKNLLMLCNPLTTHSMIKEFCRFYAEVQRMVHDAVLRN